MTRELPLFAAGDGDRELDLRTLEGPVDIVATEDGAYFKFVDKTSPSGFSRVIFASSAFFAISKHLERVQR